MDRPRRALQHSGASPPVDPITALPTLSRYAEIDAPPALRDRLRCSWRFRQGDADPLPTQVLPDGCVDLIWDGRVLFVAGPDRTAAPASRRWRRAAY